MKAIRLVGTFLLFFVIIAQSAAQRTEADRKLFDELEAKAKKGDAMFQFLLGDSYFFGRSIATNLSEAVAWFRKSAEQGNLMAQYDLGVCYRFGTGVSADQAEAIKWYRKAASGGLDHAQYTLGFCYATGDGVIKDLGEAAKLYQKAAEQGFPDAQTKLGVAYYQGAGVSQDYTLAVEWLRKASEQGDASGQSALGICYAMGQGVPVNDIQAYKWFNLGIAHSVGETHDLSEKFLKIVEAKMSREEIVEAQRLSTIFTPRRSGNSAPENALHRLITGTGFFISDDGYLISNAHVVEGAAQVRLNTGAGIISAKVVKVDSANDLALLKAEGKFAALPVTPSRAVRLGNWVATVGFPNIGLQGFAPKFARGEIAALSGAGDDARYFQISVPVQPGNSGGALVDERGNVVGVVSAKLSAAAALKSSGALPENVNYAVKSSFLLSFLESVPDVAAKLKEVNAKERKQDDVIKDAEKAAVLVLVY